MKLTLTTKEAADIIREKSDWKFTEVEITPSIGIVPTELYKPTLNLMDFVNTANCFPRHERISAIKAVRQKAFDLGFSLSLVEAKQFVESLPRFA
jgi:hypothetical protein